MASSFWDFGDGQTSTEVAPNHTYKMAGVYTWRSRYTDDLGSIANDTGTIIVYDDAISGNNKDISVTNISYRFGVDRKNGVGFSKNTGGSFVFPHGRVGGINVLDSKDQVHSLVFDADKGKFYDLSTRDTMDGGSIIKVLKDKAVVAGTGGTDISPLVTFKEDRGESERFFIRTNADRIFTRPIQPSGYPSGLTYDVYQYVDDNKTSALAVTQDISAPKHEIVFDRKNEGHRIQTKMIANMSGFRVVGRQNDYIVYDKSDNPVSRKTNEDTWQEAVADCSVWITRNDKILDRVSGTVYSTAHTFSVGPDSQTNSGIVLGATLTLSNAAIASGAIMVWYKAGFAITGVSLTAHYTSGAWILGYFNGAIPANLALNTGSMFDFRVLTAPVTTATLNYYKDDIINNTGNNILPLF